MSPIRIVFRRELRSYFATPVAYVFIVIFLLCAGAFPFYLADFYQSNQADLGRFFNFHPWLYLFLLPAISMRMWAEERKSGTIELLLTLPVTMLQAVIGKFLAAWTFAGIALLLTFPMWITVNYLGNPDNGVIVAAYIGSLLMAGAFLALSSCISALTKNQVIAFVVGAAASFLFLASGLDLVLDAFRAWAPGYFVDLVASLSFLTHFGTVTRGVIGLPTVVFLVSLMLLCLFINTQIIEIEKAR